MRTNLFFEVLIGFDPILRPFTVEFLIRRHKNCIQDEKER